MVESVAEAKEGEGRVEVATGVTVVVATGVTVVVVEVEEAT